MTDFVRDATTLPTGKTDARPLTGPASQHVTAAEWNTAMQAIYDTRTALRETFDVRNYGASTALTDNSTAFQAAINAAGSVGGIVLIPAGTWKILTELAINNKIRVRGAGMYGTTIRADTAMRSVFALGTGSVELEHLTLDANRLATNASIFLSCAFSRATCVRFTGAVKDGLRLAVGGNNDNISFAECRWDANGTMYRTTGMGAIAENLGADVVTPGTVGTTLNSDAVVGVGTTFTGMGLRNGDILRVGVSPNIEFLMIKEVVDDTHLTLADISLATQTRSTQPFAIGCGNGYHEDNSNDNNICLIHGGLARGNSGAQLFINGLYGPRVEGIQVDFAPSYGIIVSDGSSKAMYNCSFEHVYFESTAAGNFFLSTAGGITISNTITDAGPPVTNGVITGAIPRFRYTNPSRVGGVWIGGSSGGASSANALDEVGGALCTIATVKTIDQAQFLVNGLFAFSQDTATLVAGTTIAPTRAHHRFDLAGNVTMTATPTIALTGHAIGDVLFLTNASAYSLTLQDSDTLASSGLKLGAPTYVIAPAQTALFIRQVDNHWHLIAYSGIRAADATNPGMLTTDAQTIAGAKLFTDDMEIRGASKFLAFKDTGAGSSTFKITPVGDAWVFGTASTLFQVLSSGILDARFGFGTPGTDATGTPGAVTINKCNGRAAIAIGASSVVVTNSSVAVTDTVLITPLGRDATCTDLVVDSVSAGSFQVSGVANATAATSFMFTVIKAT